MSREHSNRQKQPHHGGHQSSGIPPRPANAKPAKSRSSQQDKTKDQEFLDYMVQESQLLRKAEKEVWENIERLNLDPNSKGGGATHDEALEPIFDLIIEKAEGTCDVLDEMAQLLKRVAEQDAQRREESQQK